MDLANAIGWSKFHLHILSQGFWKLIRIHDDIIILGKEQIVGY